MIATVFGTMLVLAVAEFTQDIGITGLVLLGWVTIFGIPAILVTRSKLRRRRAAARRLGLTVRGLWTHVYQGELPDIGEVRAVDTWLGADSRSLRVSVGTRLPPIADAVAHALVGRNGDEWTYRDGGWHLQKEVETDDVEAALALGLTFAQVVLATRGMSAELCKAMAKPETLRNEPGSPLWQELRELAQSQLGDAATLRLAILLRDPTLFRELTRRAGPIAGEAFSEMMRTVPSSTEAREVIDAWIARRGAMLVDELRRLAVGLRGPRHPEADAVLVGLLEDPQRSALRLTAIASLHEVGSAASIPALTRVADSGSGDERQLAREAISAIRMRTRGAPSGGLSLVEHAQEGGLAVVGEGDPS